MSERFLAILTGKQQVPIVDTGASGKVQVKIKDNYLLVKGDFKNLSSPLIASHFHNAGTGSNILPIEFELHPTLSQDGKSGTWNEKVPTHKKLTKREKEELRTGNYYINVHSQDHLFTGEIRGQLLPYVKCGSQYICSLQDNIEIGTLMATFNKNILTVSGAFSHLNSLFVSMSIFLEGEKLFSLNVKTDVPAASGTLTREGNSFKICNSLDISKFRIVLKTVSSEISAPFVEL